MLSFNSYLSFLLLSSILAPVAFITFLVVFAVVRASQDHAKVPKNLPWVGKHRELFSSLRANFRGFTRSQSLFVEGYQKYSKAGKPYVVPTWTKGPQVILPPQYANWIASRPDDILNAKDVTFDTAQFEYTVGHSEITSNDMIDILIKRELTRTVGLLNREITEEVVDSMDGLFGNGEWITTGVFDSLTRIVGRAANRTFVGKDLCSNMEYVLAGVHFARDISVSSYVLHSFPPFMRPLVGWFATRPNRRHANMCLKYLVPLIQSRVDEMKAKAEDPSSAYEPPEDWITWMIRDSFKRPNEDPKLNSVYSLAYRVVLLQFAAITTSTITATNALLDIWSHPEASSVVESLREEASRVLEEHNGEWSKAALAKLYKLDSAIRESSRVNGVNGTALGRKVRSETGITIPGVEGGLWLPKGSTVGISMQGIHFDDEFYEDAHTYDPFRFSKSRDMEKGDEKRVNEDLVTTSTHYLLFSHGLHACPGRVFAVQNIKLILAHLLLNYDIEPFAARIPNFSIGDINVVPVDAQMRIRKRAEKE
ncbi:cytochrome P450 [Flagelloscypha sp. PMI_526]|nr:cytochrome P450 [Flagelloscypha sp. PMI_526]